MAYYGYIRVSTETQVEKGGGLDVQRAAIVKYAAEHKLNVERIFTDAGISGKKVNRPALDELLLETIKAGDVIIVQNTDRLWREIFAQATVMQAVRDVGAEICSIDEPDFNVHRFLTDPENYMITSMMGMLANWNRMVTVRKLARGRDTKAAKGAKPAGICPYGYKYTSDKKAVEIDQAEAAAVKLAFTEAQRGQTLAQIAATLTAKGYTPRRSKEWTRGSVQAILRNRFYLGELTHQGQTIKGTHTPIISKVQFGKVAAQLERRHK